MADTGPVEGASETVASSETLAAEEPAAEAYTASPDLEIERGFEPPSPSPTTLESYTLNDAAAGQVRFGSAEPEVAPPATPEPEPEPAPEPEPPAAPATKTLDAEEIYSIVHKVVVKMSPPALSPQMIEDMARKFADEIISDLNSKS